MTVSIPIECVGCGAPLQPHNLTRLCQECKRIARNKRLAPTCDDTGQASPAEALHNVATILGAHTIPDRYDGPCHCGKALARTDTGLCEWCTARAARR